jgi:DNA-directed RNA polymerase subunit RPC12/RpoP
VSTPAVLEQLGHLRQLHEMLPLALPKPARLALFGNMSEPSFNDDAELVCPSCGHRAARQEAEFSDDAADFSVACRECKYRFVASHSATVDGVTDHFVMLGSRQTEPAFGAFYKRSERNPDTMRDSLLSCSEGASIAWNILRHYSYIDNLADSVLLLIAERRRRILLYGDGEEDEEDKEEASEKEEEEEEEEEEEKEEEEKEREPAKRRCAERVESEQSRFLKQCVFRFRLPHVAVSAAQTSRL